MSAVATILKERGYNVTGTDAVFYPPISDYITTQGFQVGHTYSADNVTTDTEFVVVGGSAKSNPADNPEISRAIELGIPVRTFAEVLGELSKESETIVVAGSYGKSTMTALIAHCLMSAGKDPSYFIGALPVDKSAPAHAGTGRYFVIEGDEYINSGLDHRSKFLFFKTSNAVFISAEHDHVDIFKTPEDFQNAFAQLLARVPQDGTISACTDNPHVKELIEPYQSHAETYGLDTHTNPRWSARDIVHSEQSTFTLTRDGEPVCALSTTLLGNHNIQNIIGAASMLIGKNILTPEEFANGVLSFKGVERRLDKKTAHSSVLVYEGFGSSYDKARSAISALRTHFPNRRLVVVFEPYTFSWRNRATLHWYRDVFEGAEHVFIYPPRPPSPQTEQVSHEEILAEANRGSVPAHAIHDEQSGLSALQQILTPNDVVLLLTSGNLGGLIASIPKLCEEKFPA